MGKSSLIMLLGGKVIKSCASQKNVKYWIILLTEGRRLSRLEHALRIRRLQTMATGFRIIEAGIFNTRFITTV